VSADFQQEIDRTIEALLEAFAVPCHRLAPDYRDGWVETVLRAMKLPLHPPQIDLFPARGG
jgi:hypothetical protein